MYRLQSIKTFEASAMLRLSHRLHATHPRNRKEQLLAGLCEMVNGAAGSCVLLQNDPRLAKPAHVSTTVYPHHEADSGKTPATRKKKALFAAPMGSPEKTEGHTLDSTLQIPDSTISAELRLFCSPHAGGKFSPRDRNLVDFFHAEMAWVYQADVLLTSPDALSLSPRTLQILEHLLSGLSEKQIASRLFLSPNTVHHYVKSLHKHFRVSSRSELLARWVGKEDRGTIAAP